MSGRIRVVYEECNNLNLIGAHRWLEPATGRIYESEDKGDNTAVGFGYRQTQNGWRSGGAFLREVHKPASDYPDGNPKSAQGAKKYDLMYLPLPAKIEVNRALEDGAKKYGKANWRETGVSATVYLNAAARHIDQYNEGQERASDSGVHNLGHAMACLAIIIDAAANGKLIDDRPTACVDTDELLKR